MKCNHLNETLLLSRIQRKRTFRNCERERFFLTAENDAQPHIRDSSANQHWFAKTFYICTKGTNTQEQCFLKSSIHENKNIICPPTHRRNMKKEKRTRKIRARVRVLVTLLCSVQTRVKKKRIVASKCTYPAPTNVLAPMANRRSNQTQIQLQSSVRWRFNIVNTSTHIYRETLRTM